MDDREPSEVEAGRLMTMARMIATVAYSSEFWTEGSRHDLSLALAGFLARRLEEADVLAVVRAVATVTSDAEFRDREAAVESTVRRVRAGDTVVGLPTLERLGPELAKVLGSWWGVEEEWSGPRQAGHQGRVSQADQLVAIGRTAELFRDPTDAAYARIEVGDHFEVWPLQTKRFRNWLRREHYLRHRKAPSGDAVNAALGVLEGIANFEGEEREVHNRVAWHEDALCYDLADSRWRTVRISPSGWEVVERSPVLFRRYAHQRPQVEPVLGGDARQVLDFLNVREEDRLLLLVWLVAAFIPDIPHPVPDFHGEKGSGKSVGQRVLRRLVDPSAVETLSFPSDVRELVQQLAHHYAPIYDNVDSLPPWLSDIVCRAVTGEGFSKRELYSDDEDVIYAYRRVVMLNGINVVARRPDLLDRTLLIGLDHIPRYERREEREFWRAFGQVVPRILGGVFDVLSKAMRLYPTLELRSLERMADFTRWGAAGAEALGCGAAAFLDAYEANVGVQTREAVMGNLVGAAVLALMEGRDEWSGSPSDLLAVLEEAGEAARLFRRSASGKVEARGWPGAPHILSRRLNEVRSDLAALGIVVTEDRTRRERSTTIRRQASRGDASSVTATRSVTPEDGVGRSGDASDASDATFPTSAVDGQWEVKIE